MPLLLPAALLLLLALAAPARAQVQPSTAAEIAPAGKLRVGFQTASPIVTKQAPDGTVSGIAVDLGRFVAQKLDVAFVPVAYANQQAYSQSFGKDEWDVVIGVRSSCETSPINSSFTCSVFLRSVISCPCAIVPTSVLSSGP